jgi:hypothetical protein
MAPGAGPAGRALGFAPRLGWKDADWAARRKGAKGKLKVALRLRAETTVSVKWIAERLRMLTRRRQRMQTFLLRSQIG